MEDNMKSGFCVHCGSKIINEQNISGTVLIDKSSDIENHLKIAKESLMIHDWDSATRLVENVLLMDPECLDAWYMKALLNYRNKTLYNSTLNKLVNKKWNDYEIFSKEDIRKGWGKYDLSVVFNATRGTFSTVKVNVKIDGMDTIALGIHESATFGINPGKHDIFVELETIRVVSSGRLSFTVSGNLELEIRNVGFKQSTININQTR